MPGAPESLTDSQKSRARGFKDLMGYFEEEITDADAEQAILTIDEVNAFDSEDEVVDEDKRE